MASVNTKAGEFASEYTSAYPSEYASDTKATLGDEVIKTTDHKVKKLSPLTLFNSILSTIKPISTKLLSDHRGFYSLMGLFSKIDMEISILFDSFNLKQDASKWVQYLEIKSLRNDVISVIQSFIDLNQNDNEPLSKLFLLNVAVRVAKGSLSFFKVDKRYGNECKVLDALSSFSQVFLSINKYDALDSKQMDRKEKTKTQSWTQVRPHVWTQVNLLSNIVFHFLQGIQTISELRGDQLTAHFQSIKTGFQIIEMVSAILLVFVKTDKQNANPPKTFLEKYEHWEKKPGNIESFTELVYFFQLVRDYILNEQKLQPLKKTGISIFFFNFFVSDSIQKLPFKGSILLNARDTAEKFLMMYGPRILHSLISKEYYKHKGFMDAKGKFVEGCENVEKNHILYSHILDCIPFFFSLYYLYHYKSEEETQDMHDRKEKDQEKDKAKSSPTIELKA